MPEPGVARAPITGPLALIGSESSTALTLWAENAAELRAFILIGLFQRTERDGGKNGARTGVR